MDFHGFDLPEDELALATVIRTHAERERTNWAVWRTRALLGYHYLNGARVFRAFDVNGGNLGMHTLDKANKLPLQVQTLLSDVNETTGVLGGVDLSPSISFSGNNLDLIRQAAGGQVLLDSALDTNTQEKAQDRFIHTFSYLGSCGVRPEVVDHPTQGLTLEYEIIHPSELMPFPSLGWDLGKQAGIMRERTVSLKYVLDRFANNPQQRRRLKERLDDMEWFHKQHGESVDGNLGHTTEDGGTATPGGIRIRTTGQTGSKIPDEEDLTYVAVRIREVWLEGPRGTVSRYIANSGDVILHDTAKRSVSNMTMWMPIGYARFLETGSFRGAGMYDLVFSMERQFENMVKALVDNTTSNDRYPTMLIPQGTINKKTMMRDDGNEMTFALVEPDPRISLGSGRGGAFNPVPLMPINAGDIPGRTAAFLRQVVDDIKPVKNLINNKGRVDSLSGLQFLDEERGRSLSTPVNSMVGAWRTAHRAGLAKLAEAVMRSPRPLPVKRATISLAGVKIDFRSSTLNFVSNPLPDVAQLEVQVKQRVPKSEAIRKREAIELLQQVHGDPERVVLLALEEGLDLAMWMDEEKSAYESIVMKILQLYQDGERPGQIWVTPHTEKPELQLRVLNGFMSSSRMAMASKRVVDQFIDYRMTLMTYIQGVLPQGAPDPVDEAAVNDILEKVSQRLGTEGASRVLEGEVT